MNNLNVILAVDKNYGIGINNKLPWHIKDELNIFKNKTHDCVLLVGRKTMEELPTLPDRYIYCVSHTPHNENTDYVCNNDYHLYNTIEVALEKIHKHHPDKKIFVAGGAQIYDYIFKHFSDQITLHISFIHEEFKCDTFFDKKHLDNFYIANEQKFDKFTHYEMKYVKYGENQYLNLLKDVLDNGEKRVGRNGTVLSDFSKQLKFDLRDGFPLVTTKKMFTKGIIEELLFFIRGDTDTKILENMGINIWKGNTSKEFLGKMGFTRSEGLMGPMYGYQWRYFGANYDYETGKATEKGIDQLNEVIDMIKNDPTSRRILLTDYNVSQAKEGVLYPCHSIIIQFYVSGKYLDMFCYNRSSDTFLGLPYNISSSSLLLMIIAKLTGKQARFFTLSLGDVHIYENHIDAVKQQIERLSYTFPTIKLPEFSTLEEVERLSYRDFTIENYNCYPSIKAVMIA